MVCSKCNEKIVSENKFTTGYGTDENDDKHCYNCCGEIDRQYMREHNTITLYLSGDRETGYKITNWPGTLEFKNVSVSYGSHNWGLKRIDAWLMCDGHYWHGMNINHDWNQLITMRKTKQTYLYAR